jgi:hypothetical protein
VPTPDILDVEGLLYNTATFLGNSGRGFPARQTPTPQSRTSTTSMTNLVRETQKIRQRLAKPLVARLKYKWSKKKPLIAFQIPIQFSILLHFI